MIAEYKGKTYECSFFKGKILLSSNRNEPGFSKDLDGYIKIVDRSECENEFNYQVVLDELENLSGVGSARLLHYCFDPSPRRFSPI